MFWMVKGHGPTQCQHDSLASAKTEAERLARLNPGETFTVLQAIGAVKRTDMQWTGFGQSMTDGEPVVPF